MFRLLTKARAQNDLQERYIANIYSSAANQLIGEVAQSRRRPLLGPSPG